MAYTILIGKYNNYYNRILKREDSYTNYLSVMTNKTIFNNIDFWINDGISTSQVINITNDTNMQIDYCITKDGNDNIMRWFVIDAKKISNLKYRLTLKRDVLAEYKTNILNATSYINKGWINSKSNPLLYNKESLEVNQIKDSEILLKDSTQGLWLYIYISKSLTEMEMPASGSLHTGYDIIQLPIDSINDWDILSKKNFGLYYGGYEVGTIKGDWTVQDQSYRLLLSMNEDGTVGDYYTEQQFQGVDWFPSFNIVNSSSTYWDDSVVRGVLEGYAQKNFTLEEFARGVTKDVQSLFSKDENYNDYNVQVGLEWNNKYVGTRDGRIYKVTQKWSGSTSGNSWPTISNWVSMEDHYQDYQLTEGLVYQFGNGWRSLMTDGTNEYWTDDSLDSKANRPVVKAIKYSVRGVQTSVEALGGRQITDGTFKIKPVDCIDANYNIIALPLFKGSIDISGGDYPYRYNETLIRQPGIEDMATMKMAQYFATKYGSNIYDIQILPYAPMDSLQSSLPLNPQYPYIKWSGGMREDKYCMWAYLPNTCKRSFTINTTQSVHSFESGKESLNYKLDDCCYKYRLCSPNYSDYFDYSVAKNDGVAGFNVDITFKPYDPYIHVNPIFKSLYGANTRDIRGLICGGDYSLGVDNDKWNEYKINNKSYQQSFDRQIISLDNNAKFDRQEEAISSTFQAAAAPVEGFGQGASGGGLIGGIVGGVTKGVTSGVGAITDNIMLDNRYHERRETAMDNFNISLQNIKALPNTISKVSAYNNNNKYWPFIEVYKCSDVEIEAYKNKLKYDGMTVNVVGNMIDYYDEDNEKTLIRGTILNIDINEDYHFVNAINHECELGFYLLGEEEEEDE